MPGQLTRRERPSAAWSVGVTVLLFLAGLMCAASAVTAHGTDLRGSGTGSLAEVIRRQDQESARRSRIAGQMRSAVDALSLGAAGSSGELGTLTRRLSVLGPVSGVAAVRGPGVGVSLDDAPLAGGSRPEGVTPDDVVVHQQDVLAVVNALWVGGAEAMAIQDQRVVSTSAVRCVGNTLILQGRVYSPPYVVRAIGDVAGMRAALERDRTVASFRDYAARLGLGYDVTEQPVMTLPAFEGPVELIHARP